MLQNHIPQTLEFMEKRKSIDLYDYDDNKFNEEDERRFELLMLQR